MTAQFFVLSDRIGQPGPRAPDHIRTLHAAGHGIGSHGAAHVDWKTLEDAGRTAEIETARAAIAEVTGTPVEAAAIPFGRYEAVVLRALKARAVKRVL